MTRSLLIVVVFIGIASSCKRPLQTPERHGEQSSGLNTLARTSSECPCCPCSDAGAPADVAPDAPPPSPPSPPSPPPSYAHPRVLLGGNVLARLRETRGLNTTATTRFRAAVDRWLGGANLWGFQAWHGALWSVVTSDKRYCAKAVSLVEAQVKAAETAIASGSNPKVAGDSYLEIGDMIGDLSLVYDWCHADVSAASKKRWVAYANQAVWNIWNHKSASWGGRSAPWTGWSVDNPSNNYHYSFLRATMLLGLATRGENDSADAWLSTFRTKMGALATTFERDLVGGGSREGTGYGVAMRRLFEIYSWWEASTGERLADKTRHTRASMLAMIHQTMPTLDRFAPVGDQSRDSTAMLFDYHRHYFQELIALYPNDVIAPRVKQLLATSSVPQMQNTFMFVYDFLHDRIGPSPRSLDGLGLAYYARGIGGLYARSSWAKDATWVGLQAGPYTESHAHQDQGSLLVYDGGWLVGDAVLVSKSGLPQDTRSHSMMRVEVNGAPVRQVAGTSATLSMLRGGVGWIAASVDTTATFKSASVLHASRDVVFLHGGAVVVFDRIKTPSTARAILGLVTLSKPATVGSTMTAGRLSATLVGPGAWSVATMPSASADFTGGFRAEVAQAGGDVRSLVVMSVDGAASSIAPIGNTGVSMMVGGAKIEVVFSRDSVGGSVSINGAKATLASGVSTLPE